MSRKTPIHNSWSTHNEIDFIKRLGSRKLLKNYIRGAKERTNWDAVKPEKVIAFAEKKLKSMGET